MEALIYTSRLINFKNLPEPVNSGAIQSTLCLDCQLDESDLNEMNQDDENDILNEVFFSIKDISLTK
ncbi:hypothetical protein RhiirA4_466827 [Rhizophagus irregularis]|uniref:Uncharacterized protein n=1 Tax=Rhizophagus irregularis TaxID=588596 RepID=A0A2I1GUP5_9GLOM|nr:hypothetical protein RhiirA4_466827 [Rhizophagus irregularis]